MLSLIPPKQEGVARQLHAEVLARHAEVQEWPEAQLTAPLEKEKNE